MAEPQQPAQDPGATRRLFTTMFLSLAIYSGYVWWKGPPPAPPAPPPPAPVASASAPPIGELPPIRELPFATCATAGTWTTDGGALHDLTLTEVAGAYHVTPIWTYVIGRVTGSISGSWRPYGEMDATAHLIGPKAGGLSVGAGPLGAPGPRMEILESGPDKVTLRGRSGDVEITEKVTSGGTPCVLEVDLSWKNLGTQPFTAGVWLGLHDALDPDVAAYSVNMFPTAVVDESVDYPKLANLADEPEISEGPVSWFSVSDRYLGTFVLPSEPTSGALWFNKRVIDGVDQYGSSWVHAAPIAAGEVVHERFRVYAGTLDSDTLAAVDPTLTSAVNYGWMAAFAGPMLWLLKQIHTFTGNWGWAIVALTVSVKAGLYPLITSGMKSSMKMAAVQPKMQEIREQFKDDPEEMNRRVMELFRESGANPVGGCLPLLAQMPVFASLYGVLQSSTELYHAQFLYLRDLSSVDPYGVLPFLTVALMWAQQQMMPMANMDPAQQQMMKFMPVIFGLFFFTAPSGLGVYMFVNMSLSILQQWWIKRQFPTQTPAATPV